MGAIAGISVLLKVNTGTTGSPVWTSLGGQRDVELKLDADEIDITSKDGAGWEEKLVGLNKWSMDFDALLLDNPIDSAYSKLEDAYINRNTIMAQIVMPSGKKYQGTGIVKLNLAAPYKGEATVKASFSGASALSRL